MTKDDKKKQRPPIRAEVHPGPAAEAAAEIDRSAEEEPRANPASDLAGLTGDGRINPASDLTESAAAPDDWLKEAEIRVAELEARLAQAEARLNEAEAELEEARAKLQEAEARAADNLDGWRRAQADLENFRRRVERDRDDLAKFAAEKLVLRLLPVVDNLDLAVAAAEKANEVAAVRDGIALIRKQFLEVLQKEGVEPIDAANKEFDPEFHEAVLRVDSDEYPDNTVVEELRKGYTMHGKVIRATMCKVSRRP